jgi:predicted transcriptional regulator
VLTTMRILENKGYVRHTNESRAFIYHPLVGRDQARESAVTHLLGKFFENSPELLMLNLIEGKKIDSAELKRIQQRIEEAE